MTSNPKDKLGKAKIAIGLLPTEGILQGAKAMETGAKKYGPYNWRTSDKIEVMVYINALLRHIYEYLDGVDNDKESGLSPLAHIVANGCLLLDAIKYDCVIDNRPKTKIGDQARTAARLGGVPMSQDCHKICRKDDTIYSWFTTALEMDLIHKNAVKLANDLENTKNYTDSTQVCKVCGFGTDTFAHEHQCGNK